VTQFVNIIIARRMPQFGLSVALLQHGSPAENSD
jgi:hypothetical protein